MKKILKKIKDLQIGEVIENIDLKNYTTFKISCICFCLVKPKCLNDLITLLKYLKETKIKYKVLGNGSNLVFVNKVYKGVIISLEHFNKLKINENCLVESGYLVMPLAIKTAKLGLSGLEFLSGIPGTVGGCLVNNAGAYGSDMSKVVKKVKVLTPNLKVKTFLNEELEFNYRTSFLKFKNDYICLEVEFALEKKLSKDIMKTINMRKIKRLETQPLEYPSCGSVFQNPESDYAGKIIESIGFKGVRVGGAMVSQKHANFIVNVKDATGKDVKKLVLKIKRKVKKVYNIDLVCEQEFVE